jgi:hypothetical protein
VFAKALSPPNSANENTTKTSIKYVGLRIAAFLSWHEYSDDDHDRLLIWVNAAPWQVRVRFGSILLKKSSPPSGPNF